MCHITNRFLFRSLQIWLSAATYGVVVSFSAETQVLQYVSVEISNNSLESSSQQSGQKELLNVVN